MRTSRSFVAFALAFVLLAFFTSSGSPQTPAQNSYPLELDHVLVWVSKGAPEANVLTEAGLYLQPETHPHTGQGTASKIFIFENIYLELIWIEDEQAAIKNAARSGIDMLRRARWKQTGASPFGVGLHRITGAQGELPMPVRLYWAEWMRPNTTIEFAQTVSNPTEPMYFVLPEYISINSPAAGNMLKERLQANAHRLGVTRLTSLKITTTGTRLTSTSQELTRAGVLHVELSKKPIAELTFDGGTKNKTVDLRPQLPLVLKY